MDNSNKARSVPIITHKSTHKSTKVRPKVPCHCKKCNGKLADTRTRKRHEMKDNEFRSKAKKDRFDSVEIQLITTSSSQNIHDDDDDDDDDDGDNGDDDHEDSSIAKLIGIRRKRKRYDQFCTTNDAIIIPDEDPEQQFDSSGDEGGSQSVYDELTLEYDELYFEEDKKLFVAPSTDDLNYDSDWKNFITNTDVDDLWILIWVFKYQDKFKLPDVAINSLIGFFSLLLKDIDSHRFKKFPSTAYMARKALDIRKKSKTFATSVNFLGHGSLGIP
ncbi:unnamed protein product [Rhizophagus irregularis]|nr:unnamed protein product [Rhizophagus irregularis]